MDDFPIDDAFVFVRVPWVVAEKRVVDDPDGESVLTAYQAVPTGFFTDGERYLPLFTERDYAEEFLRNQPFGPRPPQEMAAATFSGWEDFLAFLKFWQQSLAVKSCGIDVRSSAKNIRAIELSYVIQVAERGNQ
jgi:hypothetical protein